MANTSNKSKNTESSTQSTQSQGSSSISNDQFGSSSRTSSSSFGDTQSSGMSSTPNATASPSSSMTGTGHTGTGPRDNLATLGDMAGIDTSKISRLSGDIRSRASSMANEFSDRAGRYYDDANVWLQQNRSKALLAVGVLAAAGIVGYFLARGRRSSEMSDEMMSSSRSYDRMSS